LRVLVALAIAVIAGWMSFAATRLPSFAGQDFRVWWLGAKAIFAGKDPYTTILYQGRPGFLYPLTAALVAAPFARMPATTAGPLFIGISCGLLAFATTRTSWWPLLLFASGGMFLCIFAAQFTALLMLGFLVPSAMWLGALKPNIGIAMLAYRPSVRGAALMGLVTVISLISMPSWPIEWLRALKGQTFHYLPMLGFGGPLILLALMRWRRPEARILIAMALLPSSPLVYETLPLFLIARRRIEWCVLALASSVGYLLMTGYSQAQINDYMERGRWVVVWLCYLPALAIVMRRPAVHRQLSPSTPRVSAVVPEGIPCRECGSEIARGQQYCTYCHARIGVETPRFVLVLGCAAVAMAYALMVYATFLHRYA
jgi:hypothetical protein